MNKQEIIKKCHAVIEQQLYTRGYATSEDTFVLMGWLDSADLKRWKNGQVKCLEHVCKTNLSKLTTCMKEYHMYAKSKGYKLSFTYYKQTKTKRQLQFSKTGNASIEKRYATRIVRKASQSTIDKEKQPIQKTQELIDKKDSSKS